MNSSVRLGFGIAALFAAGVIVVALFGNHQSWFVRAARDNAVRCLTVSPCPRLDAYGTVVMNAPPPLTAANRCAKPQAWAEVKAASNGPTRIVVTCIDRQAYLYHMGKLAGRNAGNEQWAACKEADCRVEAAWFAP